MSGPSPARRWADIALALLLAGVLGGAWALRHWADLSALRLPDTDDVMRLQQVRDWLGGQAWGDLRQHRLGLDGGLAMHWSRLPDLPLAAIIVIARPLIGQAAAELAAVIAVPLLLLLAQLLLIAGIARRLAGDTVAPVAMLVTALAYPALPLFMPGRVDHHAFQLVLLTAAVSGMIAPPTRLRGLAIGMALFAGIATGLETLPLLAVIGAWAAIDWAIDRTGAATRLVGIGAGLALGATVGGGLIPATAPAGLCDAFDDRLRLLTIAAGLAAALLPFAVRGPAHIRWLALGLAGAGIAVLVALLAPACLAGPYGAVDPLMRRLWLDQVAEAQPLPAASPAIAIGHAGLLVTGLAATLWQARRHGGGWWGLTALVAASLAVALVQLRGVYGGVALAVPGLAATIVAARARGPLWLVPAWLAAAGIIWPLAGSAMFAPPTDAPPACDRAALLDRLATLPPGRLAAPIDLGAYALAETRHHVLAAPYHRNAAANRALYTLTLASDGQARAQAAAWRIDWLAWCPAALGALDIGTIAAPDSLARRLPRENAPSWLTPVAPGIWQVRP